ncbi:hypothetical protein ACSFC0_08100 [Serratia marcescens]
MHVKQSGIFRRATLAVAVLALPPLLRLMRKRRQPAAEAKAE